jgi:hypothetical protein
VDTGCLGAAQERPDVVRVLQRIEHEDEWRLIALGGSGEDVVWTGKPAGLHDQCDPLMAVEAGKGRERTTLDFDDRDPQVRRVQYQLLEGSASLRHDQQADRRSTRDERLLDRSTAGDELLVGPQLLGRRQRRRSKRAARPTPAVAIGSPAIGRA